MVQHINDNQVFSLPQRVVPLPVMAVAAVQHPHHQVPSLVGFPRSSHVLTTLRLVSLRCPPSRIERYVYLRVLPDSMIIRFKGFVCLPTAPEKKTFARYPHSRSTATTRSIPWPGIIVSSPSDLCYRSIHDICSCWCNSCVCNCNTVASCCQQSHQPMDSHSALYLLCFC